MQTAEVTCKNCGHHFVGKFCSNCGEKVYTEHDKSFSHLLEEVFHFLTHLDNKFFRSIWLVFRRPGQMSTDFCNGTRKKYFRPVSLFLVGVVIYLLFPSLRGLNLSFNSSITSFNQVGIHLLQTASEHKAATHHLTLTQVAESYDHLSGKFAKVLLFLLLPLAGLVLQLLFRKKNRYYFDHFILGAELSTYFVYFTFLLLPLVLWLVFTILSRWMNVSDYNDWLLGPIMIAVLVPSATAAFKRFYGVSTFKAVRQSFLFLLLFVVLGVFFIYRFILFFTILLFI